MAAIRPYPAYTIKTYPCTSPYYLRKTLAASICLDPRIRLFQKEYEFLQEMLPNDLPPLFIPADYVLFDKYSDGDSFEDENYIKIFHTILTALQNHKKINIRYSGKKGTHRTFTCSPCQLEYSEKDDKFCLLIDGYRFTDIINIGQIKTCELLNEDTDIRTHISKRNSNYFLLELTDE